MKTKLIALSLLAIASTALSQSYELNSTQQSKLSWFAQTGSHYTLLSQQSPANDGSYATYRADNFTVFTGLGLQFHRDISDNTKASIAYTGNLELLQNSQQWFQNSISINDQLNTKLAGYRHTINYQINYNINDRTDFKLRGLYSQHHIGTNPLEDSKSNPEYRSKESWQAEVNPSFSYNFDSGTLYATPLFHKRIDFLRQYRSYQTYGNGLSFDLSYEQSWNDVLFATAFQNINYRFEDSNLDRQRQVIKGGASHRIQDNLLISSNVTLLQDHFKYGKSRSSGYPLNGLKFKNRNDSGSILELQGRHLGSSMDTVAKVQWQQMNSNFSESSFSGFELLLSFEFGARNKNTITNDVEPCGCLLN